MIHSVKSNNIKFKPVYFHKGFNVVLADRTYGSQIDAKRTRNGAGKTTLLEIIHFCLGCSMKRDSVFNNDNLKGWSFILEIDINNKLYSIERFVDSPNKIYIDGELSILNFDFKFDRANKRSYIPLKDFNKLMLINFYGIDTNDNTENLPTFRELISYAVRRNVEGYNNAFEFFSKQKAYNRQVCNAYFLNLSMEYAVQFESLKVKEKGITNYKNAVKSGVVGSYSLNIGELSTKIITLKSEADSLKSQLDAFQVHPQYEKISNDANVLTDQIHSLANTLVLRKRLLNRYETNYGDENLNVSVSEIENIYSEAGIIFKDSILKPLSDVIKFHETIIKNRKEYLRSEILSLHKEINELEKQIEKLSKDRAKLMQILETHGALNEYMLIQDRYIEAKQLLEDTKEKLESAQFIENSKSRLKIEKQELLIKSRKDYKERVEAREKAISLFRKNTEFLYPEGGTLTIDLKENGYNFNIDIKSSRSQGVNYMKVFCYDMVLAELGRDKDCFPDFLIHDSTIFDGVDERQVAKALMLAQIKSTSLNFQYICLMNSDMIPYDEFDDEFSELFKNSIVMRISDKEDDGGLLGIRF